MSGHSLLVVPLPGLLSVVPALARGQVTPHVRLIAPFTAAADLDEGVLGELRTFFADVVPFQVTLADLTQFPGGSAYLVPEPAAPFRRLTQKLLQLFPELPRRREFGEAAPHLEVPLGRGEDLEVLRRDLAPWLPVTVMARVAELWWVEDGQTRTLATFGFGTSAA